MWCFSEKDEAEHRRELRFLRSKFLLGDSNTGLEFNGEDTLLGFKVGL